MDSEDILQEALSYHRKYINKRYVEIFSSSYEEFISAIHTDKESKDQEVIKLLDVAGEE